MPLIHTKIDKDEKYTLCIEHFEIIKTTKSVFNLITFYVCFVCVIWFITFPIYYNKMALANPKSLICHMQINSILVTRIINKRIIYSDNFV